MLVQWLSKKSTLRIPNIVHRYSRQLSVDRHKLVLCNLKLNHTIKHPSTNSYTSIGGIPFTSRAIASQSVALYGSVLMYVLYKPTSSYCFCENNAKQIPAMKAVKTTATTEEEAKLKLTKEYSYARLFQRFIELVWLFAPCIFTMPLFIFKDWSSAHNWWFKKLRHSIEVAGPAFIKWGQWASTRYDLFPNELTTQLGYLTNAAPVHSWNHTKQIIEDTFDKPLEEIFSEFEIEPIASGSIGQVHIAKLTEAYRPKLGKGSGVKGDDGIVAVKVQHPNVLESIELDFALFKIFVGYFSEMEKFKPFRMRETFNQFALQMAEQADFCIEAENLRTLQKNFTGSEWGVQVSFPQPIGNLISEKVLVESFEKGHSVAYYLEAAEKERKEGHGNDNDDDDERHLKDAIKVSLAALGVQILLKMIVMDNFIHADLHPGNVLVRSTDMEQEQSWWEKLSGQEKKFTPQVVLLDAGLAAQFHGRYQEMVVSFFTAMLEFDGDDIAETIIGMSEEQLLLEDPVAFKKEIRDKVNHFKNNIMESRSGDCIASIMDTVRNHHVCVDPSIMVCVVTALVLEGWQNRLDPNLNMMNYVGDVIGKVKYIEDLCDYFTQYMYLCADPFEDCCNDIQLVVKDREVVKDNM